MADLAFPVTLVHQGVTHVFADADAIRQHFHLTPGAWERDLAEGVACAHPAAPHVAVCPYSDEILDVRKLLAWPDAETLAMMLEEAYAGI